MKITLATLLTLSRIAITPYIIKCFVYEQWLGAFILLCIAAFTDTIDGVLARWLGEETVIGACLDPLADKILIVSCYSSLLYLFGARVGVPWWLVMLVVFRETFLIMGAAYLFFISYSQSGELIVIHPTSMGKWTTIAHCLLFGTVFLTQAKVIAVGYAVVQVMVFTTTVLMILSGCQYVLLWARKMRLITP
jgi:cardiolipin synthase